MNKEKRASQFGRSMIEMLGVLAIIGVLSVGGISGYTEAMRKYKMTKTIEIFRASLFRLMELDQMKHGGKREEIYGGVDQLVALGLFPEEICDKNYVDINGYTGWSCQLPVGEINMDFYLSGDYPLFGEYDITFTDDDKVRNCVDFLSYHWEKITPKEWYNRFEWSSGTYSSGGFILVYSNSAGSKEIFAGNKEYAEQEHIPNELTMDNIAKACHDACEDEWCTVELSFRSQL